jgi:hypothetical protein
MFDGNPAEAAALHVEWFLDETATNGVPRSWLARYYPGTNDWDAAAVSDTDGDGAMAWEEYYADTDPTNSLSVLKVSGVQSRQALLDVYWASRTSRTYAVLATTNLFGGWTLPPRTSGVPGDASGTNTYTEAPGSDNIFFRIKVEQGP